MIDDILLRRIAAEDGVPLGTVEKDFAISCALHAISERRLKDHLVFKGGTAIKKVYDPGARFSEDMDFTVISMGREDVLPLLTEHFSGRRVDAVSFGEPYEERFSHTGRRLRLPFTGPLRFRNSVRIDLSFRNDLILEMRERQVIHSYGKSIPSRVYTLEFIEIISEKLRAMISRGYPRDYYDTWAHIDKIQDKDALRELTKRKCALLDIEYAPTNIFEEAFLARVELSWKTQLQHLLRNYIEFKTIIPDLKTKLSFL